jgi:hypothetical protein
VLDARHRHYAAELRLIYERSGALLSRLLHLTPIPIDPQPYIPPWPPAEPRHCTNLRRRPCVP